MWTRSFGKQALERAAKSAAQALLGLWALDGFDALQADYKMAFGVAAGAAILSVLTSVVSAPFGEPGSPSLVDVPPPGPNEPQPRHRPSADPGSW